MRHAYQHFPIRPACGDGRHVFLTLGTAEKPAEDHELLQPCMCGKEQYGSEQLLAWGFPVWAAAKSAEEKQALAQHVITGVSNWIAKNR